MFPQDVWKKVLHGAKAPTAAGRGAGADADREFVASSLHQIVRETKAVFSYLFVRRGNYPIANSGLQFFIKRLLVFITLNCMKSDAPFLEKQDSVAQREIADSDGEASACKPAFFVPVCDGRPERKKHVRWSGFDMYLRGGRK